MQYTAVDVMNEPNNQASDCWPAKYTVYIIHNAGISFIAIYWSISCVYLLHLR